MKSLEALFGDLGSTDDETVKLAVQALGERHASATDAEQKQIVSALLALLRHKSIKVRSALAAAAKGFPETAFDEIHEALSNDPNQYVRNAMNRSATQRALGGKIDAVDDERERLVGSVLALVEERAGKSTRKLVESAIAREKEFFVRKLHHEVTKAMTPLDTSLRGIRRELQRSARDFHAIAKQNEVAIERLLFLHSIIERARAATSAGARDFVEAPLAPVVDEALTMLRDRLGDRAPKLAVTASVPPDLSIDMHRYALLQALQNVLQNAVEAYRPDADRLPIEVTAKLTKRGTILTLSVTDHGVGMDKTAREDAFIPFGSQKPGGTGLGVLIVRQCIVETHSGVFEIESEKGVGTTVRITLPVRQSARGGTA